MKRLIAGLTVLVLAVALLSGGLLSSASTPEPQDVAPVQTIGDWTVLDDAALEARLTHMLNRNFVYDDEFADDAALAEGAVLGLRDHIDDDGYLSTDLLEQFVSQMYGRQVDAHLAEFEGMEPRAGMIAIRPHGYTYYEHRITSVLQGTDGSLTVTTSVLADAHDDEPALLTAVARFLPAPGSAFGYYLTACSLIDGEGAAL